MNYALIGGNTKWSKILIKNFKKQRYNLKFTSSRYIKIKNNFISYLEIPLDKIDFVVLCSDAKRNIKAAKYFIKKNKPIFIEKPISNTYLNYISLEKITDNESIYFCDYQHIYSDPIQYLRKKIQNEKIIDIKLYFGKNGLERKIKASYEWFPHPLSILFFLKKNKFKNLKINYQDFKNKNKTNIMIKNKSNKKFNLLISCGNNFENKKYIADIVTDKNHFIYDGDYPKKIKVNKKYKYFKNLPLYNSILAFSKIIKDHKNKNFLLKQNKKITKNIMVFLNNQNL
jgi:hypothetical protein